jgi:hypothetical protein
MGRVRGGAPLSGADLSAALPAAATAAQETGSAEGAWSGPGAERDADALRGLRPAADAPSALRGVHDPGGTAAPGASSHQRSLRRLPRVASTAGAKEIVASVTEKQFQAQVLDLARLLGWRVYHPWLSVRSAAGFPDLVLCRPPRLILAELKTARGRLSPAQEEWLAALRACPGVEVHVWRPMDWDAIIRVLEGEHARVVR